MKINIQRIIKVLSSCVAIAMVLIVTLVMPVFGVASGCYDLKDYLSSVKSEDGQVVTYYDLDAIPTYMSVEKNGVMIMDGMYSTVTVLPESLGGEISYSYNVFPFGSSLVTAQSKKKNLVYIGDLASYSCFELSATFKLVSKAEAAMDKIRYASRFTVRFYDENFNMIEEQQSDVENYLTQSTTDYTYYWKPQIEATVPDGAVYIGVSIRSSVYTNGFTDGAILQFDVEDLQFIVAVDDIFYESALSEKIIDALADSNQTLVSIDQSLRANNDKLDELINGKDEWHQQSQDNHEEHAELDADVKDKMDAIDNATDLDEVLPDDAKQPGDVSGYVGVWTGEESWKDILFIFKPILSHGNFTQILLMIVAFINISVLLIGR